MRILFERHIPPKYRRALEAVAWTEIASAEEYFHPEAADEEIATYAAANGWVVFTRDRDFFELAQHVGCGVLYLDMMRDPFPGTVVKVIKQIREAHADQTDISESIPGDWESD